MAGTSRSVLHLITDSPSAQSVEERVARWRSHGREALAFARQAALIHRDFRHVVPRSVGENEDVVVLLHGLFATAGVLRPLRRQIEAETGAHTASFTYVPGPGVGRIALELARLIEQLPAGSRIHLVGHSLGGIVARYFVQELCGDERVAQTISLGSPFGGTAHARLMPATAGRDILPGSRLLTRLQQLAPHAGVPHFSISARDDRVVTGLSHLPGVGDHVELPDCGHNGLLFDPRAAALVVGRIAEHRSHAAGRHADRLGGAHEPAA